MRKVSNPCVNNKLENITRACMKNRFNDVIVKHRIGSKTRVFFFVFFNTIHYIVASVLFSDHVHPVE